MNDLLGRTILGFVRLIVLFGLLLLAPAGTLAFWQAWVYLLVFLVSSGLVTAYLWKYDQRLLERRMAAGLRHEKEQRQKLILLIAVLIFVMMIVISGLDHRLSWSQVPIPIVIVANVVVAVGFLIIFLVFKENTFAAATVEVVPGQKVIATGPYSILRHPMYSGTLVMLFGTPLALGSSWGLLMFIPLTAAIIWRLLEEERFLAKNLLGYREYCMQVPFRLVPFIW